MPTPLNFDPGTWNSTVATPYTLGGIYETGGKLYQYVQLIDAVPGTNGMVVEAASATSYLVTVDRVGGTSLGRIPVGVLVGSVTAQNFCFMQVAGIHPTVIDAANATTVTGPVTSLAATDGNCGPITASTDIVIGVALANPGVTGVVPVWLGLGT